MSFVDDIESAVRRLSSHKLLTFRAWFAELDEFLAVCRHGRLTPHFFVTVMVGAPDTRPLNSMNQFLVRSSF